MSNPSDLDRWLQKRSPSFYKKATEIAAKVNKKTGFSDRADSEKGISALATDYIYDHSDQNSTRRRVIDKVDKIYKGLLSKISNRKQIKCYVSRTLKPGYMCPLPTMENSYIIGYAQKDSKEVSMEECNKRCRIDKSCISRAMPFAMKKKSMPQQDLFADNLYVLNTNVRQTIRKVTAKLRITDLNETKLDKNVYRLRYAVDYRYADAWHPLFENMNTTILDENISLSFYLNRSADKVRLRFYAPYEQSVYDLNRETVLDRGHHRFVLTEVSAEYSGDKHWFCPNTQYVFPDEDPNRACKDGTIKDAPTGSSVNQVCVPNNLPPYRDPEYGGYKSQYMCESECFVQEECVPTYRQPGQLSYTGYVPSDKYDIQIGCIDEPNNEACTEAICKKLFLEDSRPILEKIWTNNDDILVTIKDGSRVPGVQRPKIDLQGELSSNGSNKDEVFKKEMKDSAYVSMIQRGTYNVSSLRVGDSYPVQMAYVLRMDKKAGRSSLEWLIKGDSHNYDNGKTYRFYPVLGINVIYHPIGAMIVGQNYVYGNSDPKIRAMDRIYAVRTAGGWEIIRRIENIKMYTKNGDGQYTWKNTSASARSADVMFKDGSFRAYSKNSSLSASFKTKLISDVPFERFPISLDMEYLISQIPGVLFVNQSNTAGSRVLKIYSNDPADADNAKRAFLYSYDAYGLYYDHDASYAEILSDFQEKQFFSSLNRKKFPTEIKSETLYSDEKVKMFIHGKSNNISVNSEFTPDSDEENKKAFFFIFLYDK
jgi:hypothetical protein